MYINIESVKVVTGEFRGTWICVNDTYYHPCSHQANLLTLDKLKRSDVVKAAPKVSSKGYHYLNPVEYYSKTSDKGEGLI